MLRAALKAEQERRKVLEGLIKAKREVVQRYRKQYESWETDVLHAKTAMRQEKDLESGAPATKGPAASGNTTTYSVELTKTPMGLGLSLTDDVVTEIKPDSQAARGGRIKVGYRLTLTLTLT